MYFESHAHYDDEAFDSDRHDLLAVFPQKGIHWVIQVASGMNSSQQSLLLAAQYPHVYASVGVHPHEIKTLQQQDLLTLEEYCKNPKVVAMGEIGLDYHFDKTDTTKELQKYWFEQQLQLSKKVDKPVIVHSREAQEDTFGIISKENLSKGVIHCYSGSLEMALQYVEMGFFIGIGGVITFKNAKKLVQIVEALPLESLLIETDSPYLSPEPNRGKRNNSQNLPFIAEKIAHIKHISQEEVANQTKENAFCLFF